MSNAHHKHNYDGTTDEGQYIERTDYVPEEVHDINPYDEDHPKAMINMIPEWLKARMLQPQFMELMTLSEEQLKSRVNPNLTLNRLRTAFWHEYERGHRAHGRFIKGKPSIGLWRMCAGVCTVQFFMDKVAKNDYYLAWIVRPPLNYDIAMQESLEFGLHRLREVLDFPLYKPKFNKDGVPIVDNDGNEVYEPDEKIANIVLKTVAFLDLRVKGSIPQKIQQYTHARIDSRNMNYNVNNTVPSKAVTADDGLLSIEDLDKKIKKLTMETKKIMQDPTLDRGEYNVVISQSEEQLGQHTAENNLDDKMSEMPIPIPKSATKRY